MVSAGRGCGWFDGVAALDVLEISTALQKALSHAEKALSAVQFHGKHMLARAHELNLHLKLFIT